MTNFDEERSASLHYSHYNRFPSSVTDDFDVDEEEFDDDDDDNLSSSESSCSSLSDSCTPLDSSTGTPNSPLPISSIAARRAKSNSLPKSGNMKLSVKWSPLFLRKRLNSKTFVSAPNQSNSLPRCPLAGDQFSSSLDRKQFRGSFTDLYSPTSRNGKGKSSRSAMLHKIAKKLGKLNMTSGSGDGASEGAKGEQTWKKKRRRSRSVSNLDSTLG